MKPFVYNESFTCLRNPQFWNNGLLQFPDEPQKPDGTFRSMGGPGCSISGSIYGNSNENMAFAIRRLIAVRKPELPGLHFQLFDNQALFIRANKPFFKLLKSRYALCFQSWTTHADAAIRLHDAPHAKRALRMQAFLDICESGLLYAYGHSWLINRKAWWKLKTNEINKHDKYPRTIVDLYTPASLVGFHLCELIKYACFENPIFINGGTIEFCKSPSPRALTHAFTQLIHPPGRFHHIFFSDDSCFASRQADGTIQRYNLDIHLCDASHTGHLFRAMKHIFPGFTHEAFQIIIDQCSSPLKIRSRTYTNYNCVVKPNQPILYSGCTLTGGINGLAKMLIGLAISNIGAINADSIYNAALSVGYILTGCEPLERIEDLQFLKHSPARDVHGNWCPLLNLGVILRASGTCKGDYPGRGLLPERARAFQSALLHGAYPRSISTFISTLKATVHSTHTDPNLALACSKHVSDTFAFTVDHDEDDPVITFDDASIYSRYRLTPVEICDLETVYATMPVGYWYNGPCVSKILELDYGGLTTIANEAPLWESFAKLEIT